MIDYLERLFGTDRRDWEEEQRDAVPSRRLAEEQPQELNLAAVRGEQPQNMTVAGFSVQEKEENVGSYLPKTEEHHDRSRSETRAEEFARVSPTREEPFSEEHRSYPSVPFRPEEREEPLEHRLRRNSRRYDSGFFLY